ncbi:hypothetical protein PHLCEN_2v2689 [Hermanssonia centrifuga]|uniref:Uncharacterized protein n=1 Tax=Hermanssonia centrifuga TaxID=98765 RepID=A0A2R6RIF8_9APHY|nr:hypothetical protein PHLCEN_2v2689 [Hermanssonia centrifuga]
MEHPPCSTEPPMNNIDDIRPPSSQVMRSDSAQSQADSSQRRMDLNISEPQNLNEDPNIDVVHQSNRRAKTKHERQAAKGKERGNQGKFSGEEGEYLERYLEEFHDIDCDGPNLRSTYESFWFKVIGGFWDVFKWQDVPITQVEKDIKDVVKLKEAVVKRMNDVLAELRRPQGPPPRRAQPWQMYMSNERVATEFERTWDALGKDPHFKLDFRSSIAKRLLKDESDEYIATLEREGKEAYDKALLKYNQGIVGSPPEDPAKQADVHYGPTGPNFGDFDKTGFRRNVLGQFGRFLKSTRANVEANIGDTTIPIVEVDTNEANKDEGGVEVQPPRFSVQHTRRRNISSNGDSSPNPGMTVAEHTLTSPPPPNLPSNVLSPLQRQITEILLDADQYKEIRRVQTLNDFELARENTIMRNQEALRHLIPDHLRLFPTDDLHTIFSSINVPTPPPNVNVLILRNTEDPVSNDASILSNVRIPMLPSPTPPAPVNANSPTLPCLDNSDLSHLSTCFDANALAGAASLLHEDHEPITTASSAGEPVSAHTADDASPLESAVDSCDASSMPAANDVSGDVPAGCPDWIINHQRRFLEVEMGEDSRVWAELISAWVQLEQLQGYQSPLTGLNARSRPADVSLWVQNARKGSVVLRKSTPAVFQQQLWN